MPATNSALRYGSVAMFLHWTIAILLIANICLGLYMGDLPRSDPNKFLIVQTHKSIGLTVLMLSLLRLGWRLVNPVPPLPAKYTGLLRFAAHFSHFILYVLIIGIPLSGWAMASASTLGTPVPFFGLFQFPFFPYVSTLPRAEIMPMHERLEDVHVYLAWSAIVLLPIHVLAALFHHFIRRDDVLKRMLPGTTVRGRI